MKMKKSVLILLGVLSLLPLALTALFYARLPETIPMHWNINGTVRYDPKHNLWLMAALSPVLAVLLPVMAKIDPRKRNYEKFGGAYQGFMLVMQLFLLMMNGIVISEALYPGRISVSTVVTVGVGLLFVFLGNIMPKVKSNFYMGVRTPWTLSDPDVWFRTNRLSGHLFFISGLIICVCPFIFPEKITFAILMAVALLAAAVPAVMSYLWYRQRHQNGEA